MRKTIFLPASVGIALLLACAVAFLAALATAPIASAQSEEPGAKGVGFYQKCTLAKTGIFDPIVHYNEPPDVGHRHLFFGSTSISYDADSASDLQTGGTTCHFKAGTFNPIDGGNFSSYWVPDLKLRDGTWASGALMNAYYRKGSRSIDAQTVQPFPSGLKMVIHDDNTSLTNVKWYCSGLTTGNNGKYRESPYDCDPNSDYKYVTTSIVFPECGTGVADSPDHISHMAYADSTNGCPTTHPYAFPRLTLTIKYNSWMGRGSQLAAAPGEPPDHADPATGFHADYFEGWTPGTLEYFVDACIHNKINCQNGTNLPQ